MKKIICASVLASALALSAGGAFAEQLWNPHLRGTDEGLIAGMVPPKGVYFINNSYFVSWKEYDGRGKYMGYKLDGYVDVPIVIWNPGFKVLGADYAVAIAQPFDFTSLSGPGVASGNGHWGTYNTVVVPGLLSWALPGGFHVKTGLAVYVDDASSSPAHPRTDGGVGSGNSFWTLEPRLGVSWLHDGWNFSVDLSFDYNLKDTKTNYDSGNIFNAEYTVTKNLGKWTVGLGAYQQNQVNKDKLNGVKLPGKTRLGYGMGPILGYNFGPVSVEATYNFNITTHNDFGGNVMNVRLVVPLD
ncbi:MAG: transporter [Alphaproteobacteria bacterium]|nr:transporter [Alphaproteobacteria bacterium]